MLQEKQIEIIAKIFNEIHDIYPASKLGKISYAKDDTWVDLLIPEELYGDENLDHLLGQYATDILLDYGYSIEFHPKVVRKESSVA